MSIFQLDPLFNPRSVAVIGASEEPGSIGSALMQNMLSARFPGKLVPVNPKRSSVQGLTCLPSVAAAGIEIDLGRDRHAHPDSSGDHRGMRPGRGQGSGHHFSRRKRNRSPRPGIGRPHQSHSPSRTASADRPQLPENLPRSQNQRQLCLAHA